MVDTRSIYLFDLTVMRSYVIALHCVRRHYYIIIILSVNVRRHLFDDDLAVVESLGQYILMIMLCIAIRYAQV